VRSVGSKSQQQSPNLKWFNTTNITDAERTNNDVLCNKGGYTNTWPGNIFYRSLVKSNYFKYKTTKRDNKLLISHSIVQEVRSLNPPGRFLQLDEITGLNWDIGDDAARSKTSQCFRDVNMNSAEMKESERLFQEEMKSNPQGKLLMARRMGTSSSGRKREKQKREYKEKVKAARAVAGLTGAKLKRRVVGKSTAPYGSVPPGETANMLKPEKEELVPAPTKKRSTKKTAPVTPFVVVASSSEDILSSDDDEETRQQVNENIRHMNMGMLPLPTPPPLVNQISHGFSTGSTISDIYQTTGSFIRSESLYSVASGVPVVKEEGDFDGVRNGISNGVGGYIGVGSGLSNDYDNKNSNENGNENGNGNGNLNGNGNGNGNGNRNSKDDHGFNEADLLLSFKKTTSRQVSNG